MTNHVSSIIIQDIIVTVIIIRRDYYHSSNAGLVEDTSQILVKHLETSMANAKLSSLTFYQPKTT